jgi:hypothetical protein
MNKNKKQLLKKIPVVLVSALLIVNGTLLLTGYHPLIPHLIEMGLAPYLAYLGVAKITFALLFFFDRTRRIGLLLLTAYLGGAIAAEIPYEAVAVPLIVLAFVWIAAYVPMPDLFMNINRDLSGKSIQSPQNSQA